MRLPPILLLPASLILAGCAPTGRYLTASAAGIPPAREIPPILAHDQHGKTVNLQATASASPWTVIFFYPRANTPG